MFVLALFSPEKIIRLSEFKLMELSLDKILLKFLIVDLIAMPHEVGVQGTKLKPYQVV